MKIAVAATGLDHIKRGVESWAASIAAALAARGCDVTLFKGTGGRRHPYEEVLAGLPRRTEWNARLFAVASRLGGWRYGVGTDYDLEQLSACASLLLRLRAGRYDIVHTQDALLAVMLQRAADAGCHRAKVILANGTAEPRARLARLPYVQELSPTAFAEHDPERRARGVFLVPNFVDVDRFAPGDPAPVRRQLGLPSDRRIVLSVGAINAPRKRMDWLIREFSRLTVDATLLIAGAIERGSEALIRAGRDLLGERLVIVGDRDHADMPGLYRAADVFALCATEEVFGIAFLEAMASGIPCLGHHYPVTRWVIGGGGMTRDMTREGGLAGALHELLTDDSRRRALGTDARRRACQTFSADAVIADTLNMYRAIISPDRAHALRQTLTASL